MQKPRLSEEALQIAVKRREVKSKGDLDSVGKGEGGMIWENGIETCIISYKKQIASLGSMQDTGCLGLVHWDDPEGWYGEGGGFRMGNTCILAVDSC